MTAVRDAIDRAAGTAAHHLLGWMACRPDPARRPWIAAVQAELDVIEGGRGTTGLGRGQAISTGLPGINAAPLADSFATGRGIRNGAVEIGAGQAVAVLAAYVVIFALLALASLRGQDTA